LNSVSGWGGADPAFYRAMVLALEPAYRNPGVQISQHRNDMRIHNRMRNDLHLLPALLDSCGLLATENLAAALRTGPPISRIGGGGGTARVWWLVCRGCPGLRLRPL
jgi:hypothetical protein